MLRAIVSRISCHAQALKNSVLLFKSKFWSSFITMLVIGITLTLPALFWTFTQGLESMTMSWQQSGHISLYLATPLSSQEEASLIERVQSTPGVASVHFKSAAEGLSELEQQEGMQNIMNYLPGNPLPSVIDVEPSPDINTMVQLDQLYQQLKSYEHVDQAKLDRDWVNRLYLIFEVATKLTQGLMLLLGLAVVFIIGNTLRLALHSRHEEIKVLKLIGATDSFIMRPFLYAGLGYGLLGAIFAVIFVNAFLLRLSSAINQLAMSYEIQSPILLLNISQSLSIIIIAMILGWFGARLSVKRQIVSIES